MNKYEIVQKIEKFAPIETQEKWDASGWIVDLKESCVNKILFALTITDQILEQAVKQDCDMIISHHPLFFVPFNKLNCQQLLIVYNGVSRIGNHCDRVPSIFQLSGKCICNFSNH